MNDINDIKLSDITEHLKREIDNATKQPNEQMEKLINAFQKNTMEHV